MAKLTLIDNVFDLKNVEVVDVEKVMSVKDYLESIDADKKNYSSLVEIYDPDTGLTEYVNITDDIEHDMVVRVVVDGVEKDVDYIMTATDTVVIEILPASAETKVGVGGWMTGIGAIAIVSGIIAGLLFPPAFIFGSVLVADALVFGGAALLGVGIPLLAAGLNEKNENATTKQDDEADKLPNLLGAKNQSLEGNTFPLVLGRTIANPFVNATAYQQLEWTGEIDSSIIGTRQKMFLMLTLGYAPAYIDNIYLDRLPLTKNNRHVLSGILQGDDIGSSWKNNDIKLEISQFGNHRTIYPYSVVQSKVDAPLLYCYDGQYGEISKEHSIFWHGGSYPTGLRHSPIKFSDSVPYKVAVGISIPSGLYETWSTDNNQKYGKIPMNLAIQWRPRYKYISKVVEENNEDTFGVAHTYTPGTETPVNEFDSTNKYDSSRYGGWRNFNKSNIVPKIKYSGSVDTYYVYEVDGKPCIKDGWYGYYTNNEGEVAKGEFTRLVAKKSYQACWNELYNYAMSQWYIWLGFGNMSVTYVFNGRQYTYTQPARKTRAEGWNKKNFCTDFANDNVGQFYTDQDKDFLSGKKNVIERKTLTSVSANEVNRNKGIAPAEGVSQDEFENCNPDWVGSEVFSFGKFSGGVGMIETADSNGETDPALTSAQISKTITKDQVFTDNMGPKDEMLFEIEAELSQEDILDLINLNPKSILAGSDVNKSDGLLGNTEVEFDSIEIRVTRLTPCYVDKNVGDISYSYSDVIKWAYIKTFKLNKSKLIDDIQYIEAGKKFAKINCDTETFMSDDEETVQRMAADGSVRWNQWNIEDYYATPFEDEDQSRLTTIAIEATPDKLGVLANSLDRISCTAHAITPSLKEAYLRYWKLDGTKHLWYDSYQDEGSDFNYKDPTLVWKEEDDNHIFTDDELTALEDGYWSTLKDQPWDAKFFPEKVESITTIEPLMVNGNEISKDSNGKLNLVNTKNGNDWYDYIKAEMQRNKNEDGEWIASDSFLNTFTDQNAIAQALGFMISPALGKDAYGYNSLNDSEFIRYWKVVNDEYFYINSDDTKYVSSHNPELDDTRWIQCSKAFFAEANKKRISETLYYSTRQFFGSFNMLALKEAYLYTNDISVGGKGLKYMYNKYIYQQAKVQSHLSSILSAARAYWFYDEAGRIEIHNDKPLSNPVLLLTDENTMSASNTRTFQKTIAGYHTTFQDEANGGETGELYVLRNGQTRNSHTRDIVDLQLDGVTNNEQAKALTQFQLAQTITRRESWNRKLNRIGNALTVGSLISIQSASLRIGTDHSGRIIKLIEDNDYVYGFIVDNVYEYLGEYDKDGRNTQGCSIMQAKGTYGDRVVTVRFASKDQQKKGITVDDGKYTTTYKNVRSSTNTILLERKIVKATGYLESADVPEEEGISVITEFCPQIGDVIAFGYVGKTTSLATVYQITPDDKGHFNIAMYPYNPAIYNCGNGYPTYEANVTKRPVRDKLNLEDFDLDTKIYEQVNSASEEVKNEALNAVEGVRNDLQGQIQEIEAALGGGIVKSKPQTPRVNSFMAYRDYVAASWTQPGTGTPNMIKEYVVYLAKDGVNFEEVARIENTEWTYQFDRAVDGYPEFDTLMNWKVRVASINSYGEEYISDLSNTVGLNTDYYGTWLLSEPAVTPDVTDRTISLKMVQSTTSSTRPQYGSISYELQVCRIDGDVTEEIVDLEEGSEAFGRRLVSETESTTVFEETRVIDEVLKKVVITYHWYEPNRNGNPKTNELAYRQGNSILWGSANSFYSQVMPLKGQSSNNLENTLYAFRVHAKNEAGKSVNVITDNILAMGTSIVDIVHMRADVKEQYVESLSTITANIGLINEGGMGTLSKTDGKYHGNFWALSDLDDLESGVLGGVKKGLFRVGDDDNYILCEPIEENGVLRYEISIVSDKFGVSSGENAFVGNVYVYKDGDRNNRMVINNSGIVAQVSNDNGVTWDSKGKLFIDNMNNIIFTNDPDFGVRSTIGVPDGEADVFNLQTATDLQEFHNRLSSDLLYQCTAEGELSNYQSGIFFNEDVKNNINKAFKGEISCNLEYKAPQYIDKCFILKSNYIKLSVGLEKDVLTQSQIPLSKKEELCNYLGVHYFREYEPEL